MITCPLSGVTAVSGPTTLTAGATATFTAKADSPEPQFGWKFNGYEVTLESTAGTQLSSTEVRA